jgi:hypothetical protein
MEKNIKDAVIFDFLTKEKHIDSHIVERYMKKGVIFGSKIGNDSHVVFVSTAKKTVQAVNLETGATLTSDRKNQGFEVRPEAKNVGFINIAICSTPIESLCYSQKFSFEHPIVVSYTGIDNFSYFESLISKIRASKGTPHVVVALGDLKGLKAKQNELEIKLINSQVSHEIRTPCFRDWASDLKDLKNMEEEGIQIHDYARVSLDIDRSADDPACIEVLQKRSLLKKVI